VIGRPSEFNAELGDRICERLADGESLRAVCRSEDMPDKVTVFRWLRTYEDFRNQYARAKDESADALADDILDIADEKLEDPQSRRVRIDARKWIASKLKPKKYGDKLELAGDPKAPLTVMLAAASDERV
jgi:hypothetical protein